MGNVQLPEEEYEGRLARIRQAMAQENIDALLVYSWKRGQVRYVSGYQPNYVANVAMAVIPLEAEPALLFRFPFDMVRARKMSWMSDVRASGDWDGFVRDCQSVLAERGAAARRIGLITGDFVIDEMSHSLHEKLATAFPRSELVPALGIFEKARLHKSLAECSLMAESARVADASMDAAVAVLAPGRSEYEVAAVAEGVARKLGAEAVLTVIAPGALEPIGPPEDRRIENDEMVVLEFAVQMEGYWTQVASTFHSGIPTTEQREMYEVAYRGYQAGVAAARPGNGVADVAKAELAVLEQAGWLQWREYDLGHGDGLDHPEVPSVTPDSTMRIEPGMVLCIHPGLRKPGVGGVFVGGTVIVGETGATPLHRVPATLRGR